MDRVYVRLYFPSRAKDGLPIFLRDLELSKLLKTLVADTGGYTVTQGSGGYAMADGGVMVETVDVVEFFSASDYAIDLAARLAWKLEQESLLVVIDGRPNFVPVPDEVSEPVVGM